MHLLHHKKPYTFIFKKAGEHLPDESCIRHKIMIKHSDYDILQFATGGGGKRCNYTRETTYQQWATKQDITY